MIRIGTRMTRIGQIYADFLEFMLNFQHKFQKIRVNLSNPRHPCSNSLYPFLSHSKIFFYLNRTQIHNPAH
ncbi:MAG: hypothetical protein RLZZ628_4018 [Bacteroidota bacterium]|jgi:hypothetical protein